MKAMWNFTVKIVSHSSQEKVWDFVYSTYQLIFHFTLSHQSVSPALCIRFSFC